MTLSLHAYLDKLWSQVFDEGASGLLSPSVIHQERSKWTDIRDLELRYIDQAQQELKAVKRGEKVFDHRGVIVDAPEVPLLNEAVQLSPIIEREESLVDDVEIRLGAGRLFSIISRESQIKELQRSLNIRRVAIFAESHARETYKGYCSDRQVEEDWVVRWRGYAQDAFSEGLQRVWATIMARETKKPGSISSHTLDFVRHLSLADTELVRIIGKLSFGGVIYREADSYFTPEIHRPMFDSLEDLGLISGVKRGDLWQDMPATERSESGARALLHCFNKAILVEMKADQNVLRIPVYYVTKLGQQVFSLLVEDADMAYLWAVAHDLKKRGFKVQIGDWVEQEKNRGMFRSKLAL
jgi:hypothetical protein